MDNEALKIKIDNQQKVIDELTAENEQLFQQFNHLMVRNSKLLKRIDDMQQIIDSMHLRIEESQLINDNMLKINDNLRGRNDTSTQNIERLPVNNDLRGAIDTLNRRIDELHLRNDVLQQRTNILSGGNENLNLQKIEPQSDIDADKLFECWKKYPGQHARNAPNLRKQSQMLVHLFENKSLNATTLFQKTGVNGVTGARYVAVLKEFNLIEYKGARKKGQYYITQNGIDLVEKSKEENHVTPEMLADVPSTQFEPQQDL
jgi:predicted transcriptional regulator/chaperonin cofactor prefoldin